MTEKCFSYTPIPPFSLGMPVVNVCLAHHEKVISVPALVDSGAALNILPFDHGLRLGFKWEDQRLKLPMGGLLMGAESYAVLVKSTIEPFPTIDSCVCMDKQIKQRDTNFTWAS